MHDRPASAEVFGRRIASKEHNRFIAHGVDEHLPTSHAPMSLLQPLSADLRELQRGRANRVLAQLRSAIGEPFFSSGDGFFLYNLDCIAAMKALVGTDFRAELSLTSPPYNIGKEYEAALPISEYVGWCATWMNEVFTLTKPTGAFWLNLGYLEVPEKGLCVPIPYLLWDRSPFYLLQEVVWAYGAGVSSKRRLSPRNEKWLFYVCDPNNYTFNLDDIRDPNVKYPNQKRNGKFRCNPLGKNPSDVWEYPKVTTGADRSSKERTDHPAQFPLGIVERIVRASSNPGEVVLDPFAGSCSSGIAAVGTGRIFVGFELKREYCEMAVNRFSLFENERFVAQAQPNLF